MSGHTWSFVKTNLFNETEAGPINESEFIAYIKSGAITAKTQVSSPTRTKGGWVEAGKLPKLAKMIEQVSQKKRKTKVVTKQAKQQPKEPTLPVSVTINRGDSNTMGLVGFIVSIVSLLTVGLLAPLGLLLSVIGLFYKPKAFAIAGTVIGLVGCCLAMAVFILPMLFVGGAMLAPAAMQVKMAAERATATNAVEQFIEDNERLPTVEEFDSLPALGSTPDRPVRFEIIDETTAKVVHRGRDGEFGTEDDGVSDVSTTPAN